MKHKVLHIIIGLILATALFVAMGHAKQKGTGLPGTTTPVAKQAKSIHKNSLVGILHKIGTGIGIGFDIGEYGLGKSVWLIGKGYAGIQKADGFWDEYVEGKTQ